MSAASISRVQIWGNDLGAPPGQFRFETLDYRRPDGTPAAYVHGTAPYIDSPDVGASWVDAASNWFVVAAISATQPTAQLVVTAQTAPTGFLEIRLVDTSINGYSNLHSEYVTRTQPWQVITFTVDGTGPIGDALAAGHLGIMSAQDIGGASPGDTAVSYLGIAASGPPPHLRILQRSDSLGLGAPRIHQRSTVQFTNRIRGIR